MHQAVQQPSIQRSWWSRLFAHPEPLVERRWVSFPDLVRVHLERTRVLDSTADVGERRAADAAYDEARRDFERAEGQIVNVYWCSDLPSAAALTVSPVLPLSVALPTERGDCTSNTGPPRGGGPSWGDRHRKRSPLTGR